MLVQRIRDPLFRTCAGEGEHPLTVLPIDRRFNTFQLLLDQEFEGIRRDRPGGPDLEAMFGFA